MQYTSPGDIRMQKELNKFQSQLASLRERSAANAVNRKVTLEDKETAAEILDNKLRYRSKLLEIKDYIEMLEWVRDAEVGQLPPNCWYPRDHFKIIKRSGLKV